MVNGIQGAMNSLEWYNPFLLGFVGVTTGAGGGIIRDIMVGTVPRVLRKQIYFTAALAGAGLLHRPPPYRRSFGICSWRWRSSVSSEGWRSTIGGTSLARNKRNLTSSFDKMQAFCRGCAGCMHSLRRVGFLHL